MTSSAQLLRDLIALPSVNPAFVPANDPQAGEHRVANHLASVAGQGGLDIDFQEVFPNRRNLFAHLRPSGKIARRIILAPHMDTVSLASAAQLNPVEKNGRLYGRGACDTKGSVAAMLTALLQVAESGRRPVNTEIVFIGLIDEENNQSGSRAVAKRGLKADLAIVGEPTRLQVVTAHKGDLWLSLESRGKAAHGARPELGKNAVHEMARIVDLLETTYRRQLKKRTHPLLGHATINVGSIRGGTQPNIVPDRCEISIDRRTLPGETEAGVRREILALLKTHGLAARIGNNKGADCLALETDPELPLVRQLLGLARQTKPIGVHYFCDAAVLSAGGIPSIVFGPGDIAQAHTADEWISLTSLERATALLTRFLRSLA